MEPNARPVRWVVGHSEHQQTSVMEAWRPRTIILLLTNR